MCSHHGSATLRPCEYKLWLLDASTTIIMHLSARLTCLWIDAVAAAVTNFSLSRSVGRAADELGKTRYITAAE